jgi:uncharacterized protein Usg
MGHFSLARVIAACKFQMLRIDEESAMLGSDCKPGLEGFGLTTANIFYHRPDYPAVLQSFIWQRHDLHPHFPELRKFLVFWSRELDGVLHSVVVAHASLIKPTEFRSVDGEFRLN